MWSEHLDADDLAIPARPGIAGRPCGAVAWPDCVLHWQRPEAETLDKCLEPRNLVIDPASIAEPVRDDSIRPNGLKVVAKAWLNQDRTGEKVDVTLTEFIDPSGQDVYFCVPNLADTSPVRLTDDEIVSWPNEFVNAHVLQAFYGPKATGDLQATVRDPRGCRRGLGGGLR